MAAPGDEAAGHEVPESVIIPPPEIRNIVDKTANFVSRNGLQFEEKIREKEKQNPKFSFLNHADPYHVYYQWRLSACNESRQSAAAALENGTVEGASGQPTARASLKDSLDGSSASAGPATAGPTAPVATKPVVPPAPPTCEFIHDIPPIPLQDCEIIKLTALFTAKNGREFMNQLATQEGRNPLFDFLRASHPLFSFFATSVEQYQRVLAPSSVSTSKVFESSRSKAKVLERIYLRAEYAKWSESQRKFVEEEKEKERAAFSSIEWNDFVVVDTIDVSGADLDAELPAPTTLLELQCETLQQRRKALMLGASTSGKLHKTLPRPAPEMTKPTPLETPATAETVRPVEESDAKRMPPPPPKAHAILPAQTLAPMRIKQEIVQRKVKIEEAAQVCPRCGASVPVSEMEEHMRIELLDPKWREQQQKYEQSRRETNLSKAGEQVVHSLKAFAEYRKDIFGGDEIDLQRKISEDLERQREDAKTKIIWDGHVASIATATQKLKDHIPIDEQITSIHKAKGLMEVTEGMMYPGRAQLLASQAHQQLQPQSQQFIPPQGYTEQYSSMASYNCISGMQLQHHPEPAAASIPAPQIYYPNPGMPPVAGMPYTQGPNAHPAMAPPNASMPYGNYSLQNVAPSNIPQVPESGSKNTRQITLEDEGVLPPWLSAPSGGHNSHTGDLASPETNEDGFDEPDSTQQSNTSRKREAETKASESGESHGPTKKKKNEGEMH